jgi:aspartate carbamoyltransferase catalytic subunit
MKFPHKHILSTKQFSKSDLNTIFEEAQKMEKVLGGEIDATDLLKGKVIASLFYEPSTRTRLSFESSVKKLGWKTITVADGNNSSFTKGESLEDNAKILSAYCDLMVMRHPEIGSVNVTAQYSDVPVINAGDGGNQHPTQALLDVYTILKEKNRLDNLKISVVWDLKYGRTAHSLVFLMGLFENISFEFISPIELKIPQKIISFLAENNISYHETHNYQQGIHDTDVIYVTRLQKERFTDISEYDRLKDDFILTGDLLQHAKPDVTIMHPLPRVNEVSLEVDRLPGAAFFRQAANGVPIRMALLKLLLENDS